LAQQYLLSGSSLEQLSRQAAEQYGADARIVRAERVLDAGLAGFLGRRHLEVTVQVPDGDDGPRRSAAPALHVLAGRSGIAALLESADSAEEDANRTMGRAADLPPVTEVVSTQSGIFSDLLARLGEDVRPVPVPAPLCGPGNLVLVMGLEETARSVTRSMAELSHGAGTARSLLYTAGGVGFPDRPHLHGWLDVARAREHAAEQGSAILAACALGSVREGLPHLDGAPLLGADQVWVVVDARHKPDETQEWVDQVRVRMRVDALAVVGAGETRSAASVNELRIPLGWVDGRPAPRTVL
jgi:hypothetical protein